MRLHIAEPNERQKLFLKANTKHVGFGGARGGGKSWAVRTNGESGFLFVNNQINTTFTYIYFIV